MRLKALGLMCFLFFGIATATIIYLTTPIGSLNGNDKVIIELKSGSNLRNITNQLIEHNIVKFDAVFYIVAKIYLSNSTIKAGEYEINSEDSLLSILNKIINGKVFLHKITIIPGTTLEEFFLSLQDKAELFEKGVVSLQVCNLKTFNNSVEGTFYPDTYFFPKGYNFCKIVENAQNKLLKIADELHKNNQENLLKNTYEGIILASIIQKESGYPEEYANISSVYNNRIKIGMPLQADPTLVYGQKLNNNWLPLKKVNTKFDSQYNTYMYRGLPPTAISFVSIEALNAAFKPNSTNYLYFVADGYGKHVFSTNLEKHNIAVKNLKKVKILENEQQKSTQP